MLKFANFFLDHWRLPEDFVFINSEGMIPPDSIILTFEKEIIKSEDPNFYTFEGISLFARIASEIVINPRYPIINARGNPIGSVQVDFDRKAMTFPFNLDEVIENTISELYLEKDKWNWLTVSARNLFFLTKPFLPRSFQIYLRRQMAQGIMSKRVFPNWPLDTSIDDLNSMILRFIKNISKIQGIPGIKIWPDGYEYCVVLTHDVEKFEGQNYIESLKELEMELGFRSAWFFVPERYPVDLNIMGSLVKYGFEIGVHGLYHDGKLFRSRKIFNGRAKRINKYLETWKSKGFRSPSAIRKIRWISEEINATYDSSSPTSERYGAQPGGCCTIYPFEYEGIIELPITLPQDHTLLEILKYPPDKALKIWLDTIQEIKRRNGLALIIVHPDYMFSTERLKMYKRLLETIRQDEQAWFALPSDVAEWWKERQASRLEYSANNGWFISGKANRRGRIIEY